MLLKFNGLRMLGYLLIRIKVSYGVYGVLIYLGGICVYVCVCVYLSRNNMIFYFVRIKVKLGEF